MLLHEQLFSRNVYSHQNGMARVRVHEVKTLLDEQRVMRNRMHQQAPSEIEKIDLKTKTMNRNDTGQQSGRIRNLQNLKRGINKTDIQLDLNEKKVNGMDTILGVLLRSLNVWRGNFL